MSDPTNVPPGWYPDTQVAGQKRWWDGAQWTEHTNADTVNAAAKQAPSLASAGTKTGTLWIWLIVLLPIISFIPILTIDWRSYMQSMMLSSTYSSMAALQLFSSPGYVVALLLSFVLFAATIVFALLDTRELTRRGVVSPFHWAFAFIGSTVYVIGRSVVVKRRTGGGLAPMWVLIGVVLLSFVVSILITAQITEAVLDVMPSIV